MPAAKKPHTPRKTPYADPALPRTPPPHSTEETSASLSTSEANITPKIKTPRTPGKLWSAEEQKMLLHFAINRGDRSWDQAVPGRTGVQASSLWKKRLLPYIEKAVEARANGGKVGE